MKRYLSVGLILILIAAAIAYFVLRPVTPGDKIRIGYLPISVSTPLFVAERKGLFARHGLDVELVEFKTSNELSTAAAAGHIDIIGSGATNAVLDTMNGTGAQFQLFMANFYVKRPDRQSTDFLLARSGIDDFAQLKGKTIAFMPGSVGRVFAKEIFPRRGIPLDQINYVEMAPAQWLPALMSGRIDAVTALEPYATVIMANQPVNVIVDGYYAEVMPQAPVSGAWFIAGALTSQQEANVVAAVGDSIATIAADRKAAVAALIAYTDTDPRYAARVRLNDWALTTDPNVRERSRQFANLFVRNGGISKVPEKGWIWEPR